MPDWRRLYRSRRLWRKDELKWRSGRATWKKKHVHSRLRDWFMFIRLYSRLVHACVWWKKIYISCLFTVYLSNSINRKQVQTVPLLIKESQLSSKWLITHIFIKINAVRIIIMPTRCKISTVYPDLPGFPATCHSQGQHLEAVKRRAYSFVVAPQSYDGECIGTSQKYIQKYALEMVILWFFGSFEVLCVDGIPFKNSRLETNGQSHRISECLRCAGRILFVQELLKVRGVSPTWFYLLFSEGSPIYQFDWAHHHWFEIIKNAQQKFLGNSEVEKETSGTLDTKFVESGGIGWKPS